MSPLLGIHCLIPSVYHIDLNHHVYYIVHAYICIWCMLVIDNLRHTEPLNCTSACQIYSFTWNILTWSKQRVPPQMEIILHIIWNGIITVKELLQRVTRHIKSGSNYSASDNNSQERVFSGDDNESKSTFPCTNSLENSSDGQRDWWCVGVCLASTLSSSVPVIGLS